MSCSVVCLSGVEHSVVGEHGVGRSKVGLGTPHAISVLVKGRGWGWVYPMRSVYWSNGMSTAETSLVM